MHPFDDPLQPKILVAAYQAGYFPMPDAETDEIKWYNPDPRTIIPLDGFHISKSLRRTAKKNKFKITFDTNFAAVIDGCASRLPTWINLDIRRAFSHLFELGLVHCVEVWNLDGNLVGGLYGLAQRGVFNAESMFSYETDASKIALWALVKRMNECQMSLLEVQFLTEHLSSLGAIEVSRESYLRQLGAALEKKSASSTQSGEFTPPKGPYNLL